MVYIYKEQPYMVAVKTPHYSYMVAVQRPYMVAINNHI